MNRKKLELIAVAFLILTFIFTLYGSLKKVGSKLKAKAGGASLAMQAPQSAGGTSLAPKKSMKPEIKEEAYAAGDRDPFAPPDTPQTVVGGLSSLKLTGITTNRAGKEIAIINEEIVPVGGKIGIFTVVNITAKKVTITDGKETAELKLEE